MTARHDLEPAVHDWLHSTLDRIPDPSHRYPVVAIEVNDTPQQRGFLPPMFTGRFQSMFSATKFVVAGAIVALFGGLLLSSVLTQPALGPASAPAGSTLVVAQDGSGEYTTIAEAVEVAEDGDIVLVRPGTYTEAITITKDITVMGDGRRDEVVIEAPEGGPTSTTGGPLDISSDDPYAVLLVDSDATLSGLTFRGQPSQVHAKGGAPTLEQLVFDAVGLRGFRSDRDAVVISGGSSATLRESTLTGGGWIAIFDGSEPLVVGNTLSDGPGILGTPGDAASIRGNTISDNFTQGVGGAIWLSGTGSYTVEDNTITDARGTAIRIPSGEPVIRGNTISGGQTGIHVESGSRPLIEGNEIAGSAARGIWIGNSDAVVRGNTIHDNAFGIVVHIGSPTLDGNAITDNVTGLDLRFGAAPILSGNTVCDNERNLSVSEETEMTDIGGNEICPDAPAEASE